jgi:Holliday junction resolvase
MIRESPSAKGARLEMTVAVDLMRQGWDVFLAASPVGPTDLVAIKRNAVLRIQVKSTAGDWERSLRGNNVLAVVTQGTPVRYFCKRKFPSMVLFESIEVLRKKAA